MELGDELNESVRRCTGAELARPVERIQSLWSGYGEILRFELEGAQQRTVIVKAVDARAASAHPRGWNGGTSHARKLRSYQVERNFYESFAPRCSEHSRVPVSHHLSGGEGQWLFVLEDLDEAGFPERRHAVSRFELEACLSWLAHFHAEFLGDPGRTLWETGCYWHLQTRPDELRAMKDRRLLQAARPLDAALSNARFQTLVHGDAKVANFCFAPSIVSLEKAQVAVVDFQYTGPGVGVKDVAYFLSSCLDERECEQQAGEWLDFYFKYLRLALDARVGCERGFSIDADALEEEWRTLYPLAWADFLRFLDGWAPDHYKIHGYSLKMKESALRSL